MGGFNFMNYNFKIHSEDNGYWAECIELEGCNTQGDSLEELIKNIKEALEVYLNINLKHFSYLSKGNIIQIEIVKEE